MEFGQIGAFLKIMNSCGVDPSDIGAVLRNQETAINLARYWKNGALVKEQYEVDRSWRIAREILGMNFFDPNDVSRAFGVDFDTEMIEGLSEIPYSREELKKVKETHFLFPGYPLSVLGVKQGVEKGEELGCFPKLYIGTDIKSKHGNTSWVETTRKEVVEETKVKPQWYLMRKGNTQLSGFSFTEKVEKLSEKERLAEACEAIFGNVLYLRMNREYVFGSDGLLVCSHVLSSTYQVGIGGDKAGFFYVCDHEIDVVMGCNIATVYK